MSVISRNEVHLDGPVDLDEVAYNALAGHEYPMDGPAHKRRHVEIQTRMAKAAKSAAIAYMEELKLIKD